MSLQNLQAELADILASDDVETDIVQPEGHLRIYKNNVLSSLVKTLHVSYPMISRLVGADFFRLTAIDYIKHYPSRSGDLHEYGEYFRDFLAAYPPVKHLTYLAEVAEFEWLCHTLEFAPDHAPLNITLLKNITPADYDYLQFILHPACAIKRFRYPILEVIELCQSRDEADMFIDINTGGVNLLIIRRELELKLEQLTADDFAFLSALNDNKSLSQALTETLFINADFKLDEKLPLWIQNKTIVDLVLLKNRDLKLHVQS